MGQQRRKLGEMRRKTVFQNGRTETYSNHALRRARHAHIDLRKYEGRSSHGRGRVRSLTQLTQEGLEAMGGDETTPELMEPLAEGYQRLMEHLGDSALQSVATWMPEGYTDHEIAIHLGCFITTVDGKLAIICKM
jgi:hypothetical protein